MPGIADRSMVKNVIRSQQRKLREEMKDIVKQKATQSAYPALSRQDKRVAEFHHDRLTQEQSLQKDTKKAERLARRIAQILDQLRKDFNKIKNFLGNYNFANTVGMDSSCGGECSEDLSTAVDTRQAWKRELENMLTMVWHYVDAQHLGDYALLHQPLVVADPTCGSASGTPVNCCPKVYRPFFHYYTPDGDCLGMATEAGSHSGDSTAVTPKGNYNDVVTRGCILGYKPLDAVTPAAEKNKTAPGSLKHTQVTNKDLEVRQLWRLVVQTYDNTDQTSGAGSSSEAWWNFLFANTHHGTSSGAITGADAAARILSMETYFRDTLCLPETMIAALKSTDGVAVGADATNILTSLDYYVQLQISQPTLNHSAIAATTAFAAGAAWFGDAGTGMYQHSVDGATPSVMNSIPNICNVEDESDLQFIISLVVCVMENVRKCQINNDREQAVIEYVRETSECNEAYHQDVFSDMTSIDESELGQRYAVGKELCADLDSLYKENCCTKQNFFNDITLDGCCW